ncbi:hypothetical protein Fmac_012495 [Flemingia macrophylla]|uniref:Uncharacterized protein n=1 Tax=Flemingia macrophylla TaxID=520843 RepID=A0ABD1MQH0_9FABA
MDLLFAKLSDCSGWWERDASSDTESKQAKSHVLPSENQGAQDPLLDNMGTHYFLKYRIIGKVDFIYGSAKSLYERYLHPSSLKVVCALYRQQTSEEQMSKGDGSQEGTKDNIMQACRSMVAGEQPHAMLIPMEYFFMGRGLYRPAQGAL